MTVYHRGKSYCYDFWYQGQRYRGTIGQTNKTEAKRIEAKIKGDVVSGKYDVNKVKATPLFERFANEFLEGYVKTNKSYNTFRSYQSRIANLSKAFSDRRLSDISAWSIEKFKSDRKNAGINPSTINQDLKALRHMLNIGVRWGKLKQNPFAGVKLFKDNSNRMRILSPEEEAILFEVIRGSPAKYLEPITITGLNTGMRAMEILGLRREHINFRDGYLVVEETKNSEAKVMPMNEQLTETLKNVTRDIEPDGYVFSQRNGRPLSYSSLRTTFASAVKKARLEDITFHTLRHTFATRLVMAGVDLVTVKDLLGHKTIRMTMRYSHPTPQHKKEAVRILDKVPAIFPTRQEKKILSLPQKLCK